jgi:hypothetical protein
LQQTENDQKIKRIIRWRETMATLNDERFFEIMRVYIGEIHTPYNKDKLIEQLSSILRKEQNRERILSYLNDFDIEMLTVIHSVEKVTKEKLTEFFSNEYPLSEIYSELLNLAERLLVYTYKDETETAYIELNPLLEDLITPYLDIEKLLPEPVYSERNFNIQKPLSTSVIAGFISYIYENPEMSKNNTDLKKKDLERLSEIFPDTAEYLPLLLKGLINLKLVKQTEKALCVDESRLEIFAENSELEQYAFLSVAAAARLGREGLRTQTQLLLDVAASLPEQGLSRSSILRMAFLISSKKADSEAAPVQGRFSRILEAHMNRSSPSEYSGQLVDQIIDNAASFGIFVQSGKTENGEPVFVPGQPITKKDAPLSDELKTTALNVNAGTSIAIMPGLPLSNLLPLIQFMNIKSCNIVSEYEITRKSISRAFDRGSFKDQILERISSYTPYKIPQSLEMIIDEWQNSYSSAAIYKGYVLKVDEKTERVIENNPRIAPFINMKLAPGIFLLNIPLEQDADEFIKSSGLDFMGRVKTAVQEKENINYPILGKGKKLFSKSTEENPAFKKLKEFRQKEEGFKNSLLKKLEGLELTKQQLEGLTNRINHRVILTEEQLNPETVRVEILEADGINFTGKIRLLESAIQNGDSIEFSIPNEKDPAKIETILGLPLMLAKQTGDSLVKLAINNGDDSCEIRFYSVSRATHIKIIRTSLFK